MDGGVVSELEALRQRIREAIYLRFGEWFLARSRGLDRDLILGHGINAGLAAATLDQVIRDEGGAEIIALHDSDYRVDRTQRILHYSVRVESIWGELTMEGNVNG